MTGIIKMASAQCQLYYSKNNKEHVSVKLPHHRTFVNSRMYILVEHLNIFPMNKKWYLEQLQLNETNLFLKVQKYQTVIFQSYPVDVLFYYPGAFFDFFSPTTILHKDCRRWWPFYRHFCMFRQKNRRGKANIDEV